MTMDSVLGIFGFFGAIIFVILLIIWAIRHKPVKPMLMGLGACFVIFLTGMIIGVSQAGMGEVETTVAKPTSVPQVAEDSDHPSTVSVPYNPPEEPDIIDGTGEADEVFFTGEKVDGELVEVDSDMTTTLTSVGYSIEQAGKIQKILNTVGVERIEIENMTGEPTEGLNAVVCFPNGLMDRDRRFHFTTDNGDLFYAGFLDEDLYDTDKGGFLKSYGDVHVPETEVTIDVYNALQTLSVDTVKNYLNQPSSADFHTFSWGIGRSDDKYKIQGEVTAKNALGMKDDLFFSVYFISQDGDFVIEGVVIDGQRVK